MSSSSESEKKNLLGIVPQLIHGAKSVVKTVVFRKDRLSDEDVERRLEVCRACPSGYAIFKGKGRMKGKGRLWSCGKILDGKQQHDGGKPCGCILRHKARDASEDCPMGHWPVLKEQDSAETDQRKPGDFPNQTKPPDERLDKPTN